MTDEEKKAIKEIKHFNQLTRYWQEEEYEEKEIAEYITTILNLIEKQSKEIEGLKNADLTTVYLNGVYDGEKKVEDKIKAEIEELQEDIKYSANPLSIDNSKFGIKVLQSLLEKE